jgi:hypothetical protein
VIEPSGKVRRAAISSRSIVVSETLSGMTSAGRGLRSRRFVGVIVTLGGWVLTWL